MRSVIKIFEGNMNLWIGVLKDSGVHRLLQNEKTAVGLGGRNSVDLTHNDQ